MFVTFYWDKKTWCNIFLKKRCRLAPAAKCRDKFDKLYPVTLIFRKGFNQANRKDTALILYQHVRMRFYSNDIG